MIYPLQGSYKKTQPFFKDLSGTTLDFQGPPTRNITSAQPPPPPTFSFRTGTFVCSVIYMFTGVFIGRANGFARESAMIKLPKRGGNGASHVHLDHLYYGIIPD